MLPLSTLYLFTKNERVLFAFQAVILSAAVFPLWLIARNFLPKLISLLIAFLYLDFIGIQSAIIYDFHEMSLLPFLLAFCFYFAVKKKWPMFFLTLFFSLTVREHVGFLLSFLALFIWFREKNLKIALSIFFISLLWSIAAIKIVMPKFGQTYYSSFVSEGDSIFSAGIAYLSEPLSIPANFFFPDEKTMTLFWSFASFGFLPIVCFSILPMIIFQFASRFLDQLHPIRWTIFYHYSLELSVILAIGSVLSLSEILKRTSKKYIVLLTSFVFFSHIVTNLYLPSPLKNLLHRDFWQKQVWMDNTETVLAFVPEGNSVSAQNNLVPHLSHREEIYILQNNKEAEYVVLDLHPGQDNWNFYSDDLQKTKKRFIEMVVSGEYKPIISSGDAFLLKRQ
jgi:uncharacterized membrane protein